MTRKSNGGVKAGNLTKDEAVAKLGQLHKGKAKAKVAAKSKVDAVARQRARRAEFIALHGKAIAAGWAKLEAKYQHTMSAWRKTCASLNCRLYGYAVVKLGLVKGTKDVRILRFLKEDQANDKSKNMARFQAKVEDVLNGKPKSKPLVAKEAKEAASVARFKANGQAKVQTQASA